MIVLCHLLTVLERMQHIHHHLYHRVHTQGNILRQNNSVHTGIDRVYAALTISYAVNKTQFLKEANVPRSTMDNFFKKRNPTIKTLAKIMHASAH